MDLEQLKLIQKRNEERKKLKSEASPGPWRWSYSYDMWNSVHWCLENPESPDNGVGDGIHRTINSHLVTLSSVFDTKLDDSAPAIPLDETPDFRLIIAARNDTPEEDIDVLIGYLDQLQEELKDRERDLEFEYNERVAAEKELERFKQKYGD